MRRIKIEVTGTEDADPQAARRTRFLALFMPVTVLLSVGAEWLAASGHGDAVVTVCLGVAAVTALGVLVAALVLTIRRPR